MKTQEGVSKVEARLVAHVSEDKETIYIRKNSPTCGRENNLAVMENQQYGY